MFRFFTNDDLCYEANPGSVLPSGDTIDRYLLEDTIQCIVSSHMGNRKDWYVDRVFSYLINLIVLLPRSSLLAIFLQLSVVCPPILSLFFPEVCDICTIEMENSTLIFSFLN